MIDDQTIAFYDAAADDYANCFQSKSPSGHLKAFLALLPTNAAVLDLGCGPAQASAHMRAAGHTCDPVDASIGMVRYANEKHAIGARQLTFDQLDMVAAYDGVWANFSLLHARPEDLPRHLSAVHTALKRHGVFHIGMKTGKGSARDRLDRYYAFLTRPELEKLLSDTGFRTLAVEEGADKGIAGTCDPWVVMRARKV